MYVWREEEGDARKGAEGNRPTQNSWHPRPPRRSNPFTSELSRRWGARGASGLSGEVTLFWNFPNILPHPQRLPPPFLPSFSLPSLFVIVRHRQSSWVGVWAAAIWDPWGPPAVGQPLSLACGEAEVSPGLPLPPHGSAGSWSVADTTGKVAGPRSLAKGWGHSGTAQGHLFSRQHPDWQDCRASLPC